MIFENIDFTFSPHFTFSPLNGPKFVKSNKIYDIKVIIVIAVLLASLRATALDSDCIYCWIAIVWLVLFFGNCLHCCFKNELPMKTHQVFALYTLMFSSLYIQLYFVILKYTNIPFCSSNSGSTFAILLEACFKYCTFKCTKNTFSNIPWWNTCMWNLPLYYLCRQIMYLML